MTPGRVFSPVQFLLRQIHNIEQLPRLPMESGRPSEQTFLDACTFIRNSPMTTIPLPKLGWADDGEISLVWEILENQVDLGFYGNGTFSFFAKDNQGRKFMGENLPVTDGLPDTITKMLTV